MKHRVGPQSMFTSLRPPSTKASVSHAAVAEGPPIPHPPIGSWPCASQPSPSEGCPGAQAWSEKEGTHGSLLLGTMDPPSNKGLAV